MKKILFLQIKGNALGGVWFVNKTLGEEFIKKGYHVELFAFRNNHPGMDIIDSPIKITTINEKDVWEVTRKKQLLNSLTKDNFLKTFKKYIKEQKKLKEDYKKMKELIIEYNPDYIISSHYQTLYSIPNKFLEKTIFVQHSSFAYLLKDRNNVKTLKKLNNKIHSLCWLCKSSMNEAVSLGFKKNNYIYNPTKFSTQAIANVVKNKKIVVITRIHKPKRIDLMVDLVNDVFKDSKYKDWTFEIYGTGIFNEHSKEILKHNKQICYKGITNNPKEILLNSSITLNTSIYEGFPLSIIEGYTCGLPVVSFNFGESSHEAVINDYNGYIIENDDKEEFKNKLKMLLDDENKLKELSINSKEFSKKFDLNMIIKEWEKEFKNIDDKK
jgi:glycosyltransferase involved in cell wall biosynthesis